MIDEEIKELQWYIERKQRIRTAESERHLIRDDTRRREERIIPREKRIAETKGQSARYMVQEKKKSENLQQEYYEIKRYKKWVSIFYSPLNVYTVIIKK